jgi:hypothetical protein
MGGKSAAELKVVPSDAPGGKGSALSVTGTVATGFAYPWAGAMFFPGPTPMAPANLSSRKAIRFRARGDGKTYRVMLFTQSTGNVPLIQPFVAGPDWKEILLPFAAFGTTDGHDLMGVLFSGGPQPGAFALQIDDVSFQ